MPEPADIEAVARRLFEQKRARRRELAALPVELKFQILLRLQQLASEVGRATGRPIRQPWRVN